MSLHSRPIPAPSPLGNVGSTQLRTQAPVLPEQQPTPAPSEKTPMDESGPSPRRAPEVRAEPVVPAGATGPWYRREPWLAVMLSAFAPLAAAVFAPGSARVPLIGLTGLALIIGAVMLVRQGVFAPAPGSAPDSR